MRFALIVRQLWLWVLIRAGHALIGATAGTGGDLPLLSAMRQPQPAVVLICAALGLVEMHRRRERNILGNLGIDWKQLAGLLAGPALAAEAVVGMSGRW